MLAITNGSPRPAPARPAKAPVRTRGPERPEPPGARRGRIFLHVAAMLPSVKLVRRNVQHAIDLVPKTLEHERQTIRFAVFTGSQP